MAEEAKKKPDAAPAAGGHGDKGGDKKDGAKEAAGGGLMSKTPVLLGVAMLLQAVVLFAGFKFLGGSPKPATAADLVTEEHPADDADAAAAEGGGHDAAPAAAEHDAKPAKSGDHGAPAEKDAAPKIDPKKPVEVTVVDFKAANRLSGRMVLYDVAIVAGTKGKYKDKVSSTIKDREGLIKDRVRTIIANCEPEKLAEPGLETLRRMVKYQLDEILGEGIIDEVFVPRCIPFRTDY